MKLSIVIPCYNEESTILELLRRVQAVDLGGVKKEVIVVDDCSTDRTRE
ncbi:MAG: glycosyltransferase, partial [bacterium]